MTTETTTETTTKPKKASNTIFLIQGTDGNEQIVRTFRASAESKSPKRALTRFLDLVLSDASHDLHQAARDGQLSYMSGHTQQVELKTQTVVSL